MPRLGDVVLDIFTDGGGWLDPCKPLGCQVIDPLNPLAPCDPTNPFPQLPPTAGTCNFVPANRTAQLVLIAIPIAAATVLLPSLLAGGFAPVTGSSGVQFFASFGAPISSQIAFFVTAGAAAFILNVAAGTKQTLEDIENVQKIIDSILDDLLALLPF